MGIATGIKGLARLKVIQLHRLLQFEEAFTLYLEGKVSSVYVTAKAKKMLEVGLPHLR